MIQDRSRNLPCGSCDGVTSWPADNSASTADAAFTSVSAVGVKESLSSKWYLNFLQRRCISTARSSTTVVCDPRSVPGGGVGEVPLFLTLAGFRHLSHLHVHGLDGSGGWSECGSDGFISERLRNKVVTEDPKLRRCYLLWFRGLWLVSSGHMTSYFAVIGQKMSCDQNWPWP